MITEALREFSSPSYGEKIVNRELPLSYLRDTLLQPQYLSKLSIINDKLKRLDINYAVVGSVGVALTCNEDFDPFENMPVIKNYSVIQTIRDIDIIILGNENQKQKGNQIIQEINGDLTDEPYVDITKTLNKVIIFENKSWFLNRNSIKTPISSEISKTYDMSIFSQGISVPVLHPKIQLLLLQLNNPVSKISKIDRRIESLRKFIASNQNDFPQIDNAVNQKFSEQLLKVFLLDTGQVSIDILKKYYAKKTENHKNIWLKKAVQLFK